MKLPICSMIGNLLTGISNVLKNTPNHSCGKKSPMSFQNRISETAPPTITASYSFMQNILGVSLGTRFVGMAVIYNGELADYRVRTFYSAWSKKKQRDMLEAFAKTVERYNISKIVVKTPKPSHCSQNILDVINDLRQLSEQRGIKLATCTITALKTQYMAGEGSNKQALVQAICRNYSQHRQLAVLCAKKRIHRTLNYVKMFEAIACAEMALETGLS